MPYTKHNFQSGDILRAAELNDIDDQIYELTEAVEDATPGTLDYADLTNKPQIAGVTLVGNKSLSDLGIAAESDVEALEDEVADFGHSVGSKAPAILKSVSCDIVTFDDGAEGVPLKECVVSIDPVQDLHGYDNPWPDGGGKNKLKNSLLDGTNYGITFAKNADGTISVSGTNDGTSYSSRTITADFQTESGVEYTLSGGISDSVFVRNVTAGKNAGSSPVTFTGDGTAHRIEVRVAQGYAITGTVIVKPMICLSSASEPAVYAPYSNICPITGHTGANVYRMGKNLLNSNIRVKNGGNIFFGGATTNTEKSIYLPAGTYTFTVKLVDPTYTVNMYLKNIDTNTAVSGFPAYKSAGVVGSVSFTLTKGANLDAWVYYPDFTSVNDIDYALIERDYGVENTPYIGQTYPISWQTAAGTVYKGHFDTKSGKLTVTGATVSVDGTGWSESSSSHKFYKQVLFGGVPGTQDQISSMYLYGGAASRGLAEVLTDKRFYLQSQSNNSLRLWIYDTDHTLSELSAMLDETPITVTYTLDTPVTYQFDPVQITTLLGENNIWADTGAVGLMYPADTKIFIDNNLDRLNETDFELNRKAEGASITHLIDFPKEELSATAASKTIKFKGNKIWQISGGTSTTYRYFTLCKSGIRVNNSQADAEADMQTLTADDFMTLPETNGAYNVRLDLSIVNKNAANGNNPIIDIVRYTDDTMTAVERFSLNPTPGATAVQKRTEIYENVTIPGGKFAPFVVSRNANNEFEAYINFEPIKPDGNMVSVTGKTPTITGKSGKRYVCGTVDSISITPSSTGIIDVIFTSGTTAAVLTIPNTVKFPTWFNPSNLDASTTYEINIQDGVYGAVMAWT